MGKVVYTVWIANAAAIAVLWWLSSGFEMTHSSGDAFNGIGRITGLLGTYLVLCQLLLFARTSWLESAFGFERLSVLHRWNGFLSVSLLVAHAAFQTIGYALGDGKDVVAQLADFITRYTGLLGAIAGLGLFITIGAVSITIARRKLSYETWYYIHLYSYVGVALAFTHQVATGVDFVNNPVFVFYWYALYVFVVGSLLLHRFAVPIRSFFRHRFRVQSVQREGRGVFSIYITGRDLDRFGAVAGQFAIWRFLDRERWWQAHPFSISAVPDGRRLRLTVKNVGDFTRRIHTLRPGTAVLVEGPFGTFVERPDADKVLLIAGGIGITPIRPLAEELARDGVDVRLLYRAHSAADLVFKDELETLASRHPIRIDYLLTEHGSRKRRQDGWFDPEAMLALVPELKDRVVYICGPAGMTKTVRSTLREIGIEPAQIRTEVFRY
jgi:predicted ferric reductase